MRPIKLILSAFGPFATTEEVDFREATDAGLFGIYGPTGAGKSSIFNAITFALFGEGAKKEQAIVTMRSAHAAPEQLTEVTLLFELGAKRYLVRRQPDQLRPKARGEGETIHAHAAWLFDVSDIDVDTMTAQSSGRVLAERKVGDVRREIEGLLGYGPEQFRQIVLLPQGRFERFLVADSKDRLDILRELFDVSLYRNLTARMKDAAQDARRAVEDGRRAQVLALSRHGYASSEELAAGISASAELAEQLGGAAREAEDVRARAEQSCLEAEALDRRFDEAEMACRLLTDLQGQAPAIAEKRGRRDRAELARRAADLEAGVVEAERELDAARATLQSATQRAEAASEGLQHCEIAFEAENSRAGEREALQIKGELLARYDEALRAASDLQLVHSDAVRRLGDSQRAAEEAGGECDRLTLALLSSADRLGHARQTAFDRLRLEAEMQDHRVALEQARAYHACAAQLEAAKGRAVTAASQLEAARSRAADAARQTQESEQIFVEAQAHRLALHLVDGHPCPVCGAPDHPEPARNETDPQLAETNWRAAQAELRRASAAEQEARAELGTAQGAKAQLEAELSAKSTPARAVEDIEAAIAQAGTGLAALGDAVDIDKLEKEEASLREQQEQTTKRLATLTEALQQARTQEAVARRAYEDRIADVPDAYRAAESLAEAQQAVIRDLAVLRGAMEKAIAARQEAADEKVRADAQLEAVRGQSADLGLKVERARAAFGARLDELALSLDDYVACRPDIAQIEQLAEEIRAFEMAVAEAQGRAAEARSAIEGVERPALDAIRGSRDAAREAARLALGAAADAKAAQDALLLLQSDLAAEMARLEALETETGPLRALAEAFDGQNEMRTALETYAIGAMFDHVIESANLRLDPMTAGRYHFERDTQSIGGRSKRGLDIRIFDVQTGRTREIATLSGGETFIAALALALGLSDVVEMNHGGIRLDTIFIDEGFGSLDTENDSGTLDLVLQVLQDIVGKSRAVGLISHVPLVQQAVPNGFSVIKELGGNRIEKRKG